MSIDIEDLSESELLPTLGSGDWEITLPPKYDDLIVSEAWREDLCAAAADTFIRWVLAGTSINIVHDYDPPWDQSGDKRPYRVDPAELLGRYETFKAWMDEEYTGESRASFVSGMGLFWDDYGDAIKEDISEAVAELMTAHFKAQFEDEDEDSWWDDAWEDTIIIQSSLEHALYLIIADIKTADAWRQYADSVRADMEAERQRNKERAKENAILGELIRHFWEDRFSDLDRRRIERPEFKALQLADRIQNALADADPRVVEAIIQFGLPGHFSNSVAFEIQQIARKVSQADRNIVDV